MKSSEYEKFGFFGLVEKKIKFAIIFVRGNQVM